ncbi:MAG: aminotransferase class III-fold pyridoxal phosphate-dependent enzyme [Betaproteobacteria bacterium]
MKSDPSPLFEPDVLHTWCVQADWRAPTIVGGRGAMLVTADGREILDFSSLAECSNLGHQHPRVVAAIKAQADSLCFVTSAWGARPRQALAHELLDLAGFAGGRVLFTLAGADANENAVKLARWYTGKPEGRIVARDRSYHGATFATMALSGDARVKSLPSALPNVAHVPPPYCYRCPWGLVRPACGIRCADEVGAALAAAQGNVAAVIMEPHAGTNGIVAPLEYWPRLRSVCDEHGALLIADEVMSAFGRVGEWFGWQRYGSAGRPDLVTLAKGLTGAHAPLGALLVSPRVAEFFETRMLETGLTYSGHPLSCAAGLAALAAYRDERLIERAAAIGATMRARLCLLAARHPAIGEVRGDGAFWVIELVRDRATREPLSPWPQTAPELRRLVALGLARDVSFAVRGNLVLLAPPLVMGDAELDRGLSLLDSLLTECLPAGV